MKQQWFCAQKRKEFFWLWSCSYPISKILYESCETNPLNMNQKPGLSSHAESEREACLPSVLSKALHPLKAHVQGVHQVAYSLPSLALLSRAQCRYWLPPLLTSTTLLGFSDSFSHSRSCMEGEIQPHERGSPTPIDFQNLSISFLHQPLFSQLWRLPHVFTRRLHSGHSNPSP